MQRNGISVRRTGRSSRHPERSRGTWGCGWRAAPSPGSLDYARDDDGGLPDVRDPHRETGADDTGGGDERERADRGGDCDACRPAAAIARAQVELEHAEREQVLRECEERNRRAFECFRAIDENPEHQADAEEPDAVRRQKEPQCPAAVNAELPFDRGTPRE